MSTEGDASRSRRTLLRALVVLGGAALAPRAAQAREYTSAAEVLETIEQLAAAVDAALSEIAKAIPAAQLFAASARADHVRERADRDAIRDRLRLPAAPARIPQATPLSMSLDALRATQQELVHAHAEGLPALHDAAAVQVLAQHMVEAARRLTVIDLWIDREDQRAG